MTNVVPLIQLLPAIEVIPPPEGWPEVWAATHPELRAEIAP